MEYFETHAHPDYPLIRDKNKYINDMRAVGIKKMIIAPITYESNYRAMEYFPEEKYPEVFFAKGLHPKCAMDSGLWEKEKLGCFKELVQNHRVVAIKSGLDLSSKTLSTDQIQNQIIFLKFFMEFAYEKEKPLVLHVQNAAKEVLKILKRNPLKTEAEIHCFAYDKNIMEKFIDAGVKYFGIGGRITKSENGNLQEAVKYMPLEMILLESDSPFVSVEGNENRIGTSAKSLPIVVKKIAEIKSISENEVAKITYSNACNFFGVH